jgi:hypothetical protein
MKTDLSVEEVEISITKLNRVHVLDQRAIERAPPFVVGVTVV